MAQKSFNSLDKVFEQMALDASITKKIEEKLNPILTESEKLKKENEELQKQLIELQDKLGVREEKFSTVTQQLLIVKYLLDLDKLKENKGVKQLGAFFSRLFNRHPQTAREPFSSFNELVYSANKAKAKTILKNLLLVQKDFEDFGLQPTVKKIQKDIDVLNNKHFK